MKTLLRAVLLSVVASNVMVSFGQAPVIERGAHLQSRDTKAQFRLFPAGAVVEEGLFRLIVTPDLAVEPTLDLQMPDGKRLQISPRWLAFFDRFTGQSAMIAAVKPCVPHIRMFLR